MRPVPARGEGRTAVGPLRGERAPRGHGSSADTAPKPAPPRFLAISSLFPKVKNYCCQYNNSSAKMRLKHSFLRTSLRRIVLGQHPWKVNAAIWRCDLSHHSSFHSCLCTGGGKNFGCCPSSGFPVPCSTSDVTRATDPRNGSCHKCSLKIPSAGLLQPQTSLLHQPAWRRKLSSTDELQRESCPAFLDQKQRPQGKWKE